MDGDFTAEQRTLRARLGAYRSWSRTVDPAARTAPARRASLARFERQVDPCGVLPPEQRARLANAAMKAFYTELALRSSRSRTKAARARRQAGQLDADALAADAELAATAPEDGAA